MNKMKTFLNVISIFFLFILYSCWTPYDCKEVRAYLKDYSGNWKPVQFNVNGIDSIEVIRKLRLNNLNINTRTEKCESTPSNINFDGRSDSIYVNYYGGWGASDNKITLDFYTYKIDSLLYSSTIKSARIINVTDSTSVMPIKRRLTWDIISFKKGSYMNLKTTYNNKQYEINFIFK